MEQLFLNTNKTKPSIIGKSMILNKDGLKQITPSAFTPLKNKLNVCDVLDQLTDLQWYPIYGFEKRSSFKQQGFMPSHIKFRNPNLSLCDENEQIECFPELLISSYPNSSLQTRTGLFRISCSNGLVTSDKSYGSFTFDTVGDKSLLTPRYNLLLNQLLGDLTTQVNQINILKYNTLTQEKQMKYATDILSLAKLKKVKPEDILKINRDSDKGNEIWNVFNTVQENVMNLLGKDELHVELNEKMYSLALELA